MRGEKKHYRVQTINLHETMGNDSVVVTGGGLFIMSLDKEESGEP